MSFVERNIKVIIEDTDAFGRLNWRVYCRYCELGEAGLMDSLGFAPMYFYDKYGISFPRRVATFEYFSQVTPRDSVDLRTEVKKVGTTSLTLTYTFYKKNEKLEKPILAAKAEVVIVAYDEENKVKITLPRELVERIREFCPEVLQP
jgi:acyl-CoA thioesterase FadM